MYRGNYRKYFRLETWRGWINWLASLKRNPINETEIKSKQQNTVLSFIRLHSNEFSWNCVDTVVQSRPWNPNWECKLHLRGGWWSKASGIHFGLPDPVARMSQCDVQYYVCIITTPAGPVLMSVAMTVYENSIANIKNNSLLY